MRRRGFLGGAAAGVAAAWGLSGCGTDDGSAAQLGTAEDPITWIGTVHTAVTPEPDGPIEAKLEEYTGEKFEMHWVPAASSEEKLNSALASGELADIVDLGPIDSTTIRQALTSGMFWEVESYFDDYPNLSKIDAKTRDLARVDGKVYGIPGQGLRARYGVVVRKDWLDNLGLEVPHTIEALSEVALAFAQEDPDGNGKNDTTGFIDREESFHYGFRSLTGYFGAGDHFEVADDGRIVPSFTTEAFKEAMAWYRDLYQKGAVNKEFITLQKSNQQDAIAQGKGGIVVTGLFEAKNYMALAQSADPETPMEWALINDITYGDVPRRILSDTNSGMGGWRAFPKSEVKTEEELRKLLAFVDKLGDDKPNWWLGSGIEGVHYKLEDDGAVTTIDQTKWEQEVQPYSGIGWSPKPTIRKSTTPYVNEANEKILENEKYAITNPAQSLTSQTYNQQWSSLEEQANDAYNRYLSGQLEMAGYEAVMDKLRGQGMDKVIEEYTAAYQESGG